MTGSSAPTTVPDDPVVAVTVGMNVYPMHKSFARSNLHLISRHKKRSAKIATGGLMDAPLTPVAANTFWFPTLKGAGYVDGKITIHDGHYEEPDPEHGVIGPDGKSYLSFRNNGFRQGGYAFPVLTSKRETTEGSTANVAPAGNLGRVAGFTIGAVTCGGKVVVMDRDTKSEDYLHRALQVYTTQGEAKKLKLSATWDSPGKGHGIFSHSPICVDGKVILLASKAPDNSGVDRGYILTYDVQAQKVSAVEYAGPKPESKGGRHISTTPSFGASLHTHDGDLHWVTEGGRVLKVALSGGQAEMLAPRFAEGKVGFVCRFHDAHLACVQPKQGEIVYERYSVNDNFKLVEELKLPDLQYVLDAEFLSYKLSDVLPLAPAK